MLRPPAAAHKDDECTVFVEIFSSALPRRPAAGGLHQFMNTINPPSCSLHSAHISSHLRGTHEERWLQRMWAGLKGVTGGMRWKVGWGDMGVAVVMGCL